MKMKININKIICFILNFIIFLIEKFKSLKVKVIKFQIKCFLYLIIKTKANNIKILFLLNVHYQK